LRWVQQLETQLKSCYESMRLPTEAGLSWGKPGARVEVEAPAMFLEPVNGKHNGNGNGKVRAPKLTTTVFVPRVPAARAPLAEPN
ncbi:MAG: hypothetical protein H7Z14_05090, partial [Anaerolineae bacterium]|nr:hypothetical protein [Phycisphaerae bacterium]